MPRSVDAGDQRGKVAPAVTRQWGSVARNGAEILDEPSDGSTSTAWRNAVVRARSGGAPPSEQADGAPSWVRDEEREVTDKSGPPAGATRRRRTRVPASVTEELVAAAGAKLGAKLAGRLAEASDAYDRDRYQDAARIVGPLARAVPGSAAVRELYGLTLYRMGRWRQALKELDVHRSLSASYDQHPVMMDCHRALRSHRKVEQLWQELRQASPSREVVAEGRVVMAGSLADRGDLPAAIRLLERDVAVRKPHGHHLREWYALADLYERSGDVPRARDLFGRIDANDRAAFDTVERLRALR